MGTRGYKAWRFRKRYYVQYNHWDSYPSGLGTDIAAQIPSGKDEYQAWLKSQREELEVWEATWLAYLALDPTEVASQKFHASPSIFGEVVPSFLVPLNDLYIEWVYVLDLDREIFTVNNGAHFKLDQIPHLDWIDALAVGELGDQIALPGAVPKDALANLVADPPIMDSIQSDDLPRCLVTPKCISEIPWRRRHGPCTRLILYYIWNVRLGEMFSSSLLQWCADDEPFREFAFAILCLVKGGCHVTAIPKANVKHNDIYGFNKGPLQFPSDIGFMSCLATGAHIEGFNPGSSPPGVVYWLEDVLVFLTTQLYRPGALDSGISHISKYCQQNYPGDVIDAILMSIEHVVLVHIVPNVEIQHSSLLPLLDIRNHITLDVSDRYSTSYLKKKQGSEDDLFAKRQQKKMQKAQDDMMTKTSGFRFIRHGDPDDDDISSQESDEEEEPSLHTSQIGAEGNPFITFYALCHIFDAAARRRMPPVRSSEGCLPNELYPEILKHVLDYETRASCTYVSRTFRNICQENILFADGIIMEPSDSCQACDSYSERPEWLNVYDVASGASSKMELRECGEWFFDPRGEEAFLLAVGKSPGIVSLLPQVAFRFSKVANKQVTTEASTL